LASFFVPNPDLSLGLRYDKAKPDGKAVRGKLTKKQHLLFEIHSSATDRKDKVAKPLILSSLDSE
jgi:hypothetical protein